MKRQISLAATMGILWAHCILAVSVGQDAILDWNRTIREVIQANTDNANPGWSTRAMAMTNGALYDVTMGFSRTYQPFRFTDNAPVGASRDAAYAQAAYNTLLNSYPNQQAILDAALASRLSAIPNTQAKVDGLAYGSAAAQNYINWRTNDGVNNLVPYTPVGGPGHWTPDPYHNTQQAWGPGWGTVNTFAMSSNTQFTVPGTPAMTSQAYTDAFNQVKSLGVLSGSTRTADQTNIGLFWAYDRPTMGPPPVLYTRNLEEISQQMGNTTEQNARLFAMASVSMADASIAAWEVKFKDDFWRPVTAIQLAGTDGNPNTIADPNWQPLGAPGANPLSSTDDFTPPFPAYVSGHATFGGAVFESLRDFYGTDVANFTLTSQELIPGQNTRTFTSFSQAEEENAISRVYLGIHWEFDVVDGVALGNNIASYVSSTNFQAVPEPSSLAFVAVAALVMTGLQYRRRARAK